MNVVMITGGQLIAYFVATAFSGVPDGWRYMMGLSAIPAIIQLIGMPFLPESPRYMLLHGREKEALKVTRSIYGGDKEPNSEMWAQQEVDQVKASIAETSGVSFSELLAESKTPLMIACMLQALQQLTGFNTAMYYSATILKMAGFRNPSDAIGFSILVAGTNMVLTLVALMFIDRVGRRRMLVWTVAGVVIGLALLGISFSMLSGFIPYQEDCSGYGNHCGACLADDRCMFLNEQCQKQVQELIKGAVQQCPGGKSGGWFALASLVFYVAMYALGLGNVPWLLQSEIFTPRLRGLAGGIATSVNWVSNLIIAITFLSLTQAITAAGTFWMYGLIGVIGWCLVYKMVPETKGKSLEEIQEMFSRQRKDRASGNK